MRLPEQLLHFIWQHQLFDSEGLQSITGREIQVVSPGVLNHNAGPDFNDALIRVGDLVWSGPIEIHVKSSEYFQHGHQHDAAYDKIVLHVVWEADCELNHCETITLRGRVPETVLDQHLEVIGSKSKLPCDGSLAAIDDGIVKVAFHESGLKRLAAKSLEWSKHLTRVGYNYNTLFIAMMAKALGASLNGASMLRLVEILSVERRLNKILANGIDIEPILFGVAGYAMQLDKEQWRSTFDKWQLVNQSVIMDKSTWKYSRTRQWSFPTIRIAELASLIRVYPGVDQVLQDAEGKWMKDAMVNSYWCEHYNFRRRNKKSRAPQLSKQTMRNVQVNAIAPFLHLVGSRKGEPNTIADAIHILKELAPEDNKYIRMFKQGGVEPNNALESQGVLQLFRKHCSTKKCLNCIIGQEIIRKI